MEQMDVMYLSRLFCLDFFVLVGETDFLFIWRMLPWGSARSAGKIAVL